VRTTDDGSLGMGTQWNKTQISGNAAQDELLHWKGDIDGGLAYPPLLMRHFSKDMYPHASRLAEYIDAFIRKY